MKRFVIGDIHGEYDQLVELLEKVDIDKENDLLIQIGDIVDRGPEPFKCMDKLLEYKKLRLIVGNHDQSFLSYIETGYDSLGEYSSNGSGITKRKWHELDEGSQKHYKLMIFDRMKPYYVLDNSILFVHGGFDPSEPIENQTENSLCWDRELVQKSFLIHKGLSKDESLSGPYKRVYIGHTPTLYFDQTIPMSAGNIVNVDTGCGKGGLLTIMNIDTHEYWQSKPKTKTPEYAIIKKSEKAEAETDEERSNQEEAKRAA